MYSQDAVIATTQNEPRQIELLAAQRQVYASAKGLFALQVIFGAIVAAALAFVSISEPRVKEFAQIYGITFVLIDLVWINDRIKRLREKAARIQEEFDCRVLGLPWNTIKTGSRPEPEQIREEADRYAKRKHKMPPLTDWYSPSVSDLPVEIGRIACQRSNCWWDSKQRRRFASGILLSLLPLLSIVLWCTWQSNMTVYSLAFETALPMFPVITIAIRQWKEHTETSTRRDRLRAHLEALWKEALQGVPKSDLLARSRSIQDEIFDNRSRSPLVPEWIFKWLRPRYEVQMNFGSSELVAEAKRAGVGDDHSEPRV